MNDETTQSLKKLWEDNAYPSATPLYKLAKRRGLNVRIVDVENWLKNRASTSLLQQRKEPYAVAGSFDNATKSLERVYLDLLDQVYAHISRWIQLPHDRSRFLYEEGLGCANEI